MKYSYQVEHEGFVGTIEADSLADAIDEAKSLAQDGDYPNDGCTISARITNVNDADDTSEWIDIEVHPVYVVKTDAFEWDGRCESTDDAIEQAFDGEIKGIVDEASLEKKFAKYVADGGWCWIECAGERVVEINC